MELSVLLSSPAPNTKKLLAALASKGYIAVIAGGPGFDEPPTIGYVAAFRPRTSEQIPVVEADSDIDRIDLSDAQEIAQTFSFKLRAHGHRSTPLPPDEITQLRELITSQNERYITVLQDALASQDRKIKELEKSLGRAA